MDLRPNQSDRELALRKYFENVARPSTAGPILLFVVGLLCLSLPFLLSPRGNAMEQGGCLFIVIGLILCVVGGLRLKSIDSRYGEALEDIKLPSDRQVDSWFQESRDRIVVHSKHRLDLADTENDFSKPLIVDAPTLSTTYGVPNEDLAWRKGNDDILRFAIHKFLVIYLTERHPAAYTCDFNFLRDVPLNETTREYHYQDIVSVATFEWSQSFSLPTGEKLSTSQIFRLSVASGEYIEVKLDNDQLRKMTQQEEVPTFGADKAVTTIRAMLRDRKALAA